MVRGMPLVEVVGAGIDASPTVFPPTGEVPSVLVKLETKSRFKPSNSGCTTLLTTKSSLSITGLKVSCTNLGHWPLSRVCSRISQVSHAVCATERAKYCTELRGCAVDAAILRGAIKEASVREGRRRDSRRVT